MRALVLNLLLLAGLASCDKDEPEKREDFSPDSAGSTWTYQNEQGATYTITATNRDTTLLGKSYRVFTATNGVNQYRLQAGNDYYRSATLPGISTDVFEELYLKDNVAANGTWQTTQVINVPGIPVPLNATLAYRVVEKGVQRTVNNRVFNNVIHVRLDVNVAGAGPVGGGDFYYAEGVGMIQNSVIINFNGQQLSNTSEMLMSYTIQ